MNTRTVTDATKAPSIRQHSVSLPKREPESARHSPPQGTRDPTRIGELLRPLQRIIRQPDRNRLLADFFSE